jgi:hypothetical protein
MEQHVGFQKPPAKRGLLDLPAEIRLAVLQQLIDGDPLDVGLNGQGPKSCPLVQPSISRVNRTIRNEALDIWYSSTRFAVQFRAKRQHSQSATPDYELVTTMPPSAYSRIRKFDLCFVTTYGMNGLYYNYSIDMDRRNNSYTLAHLPKTDEWWVGFRPWDASTHKKAERRALVLRKRFDIAVAEMIAMGSGVNNLTIDSYRYLAPQASWQFGEDLSEDVDI